MTARLHPDIRWPDGRAIVTDRVFPNDIERPNAPDWTWRVEDYDLGDPCHGYFATEQDALEDAQSAISEAAEDTCPDADAHGPFGCRTCGLEPLTDD